MALFSLFSLFVLFFALCLSLYTLFYFTSFTWTTSSSDLQPCLMSYYHTKPQPVSSAPLPLFLDPFDNPSPSTSTSTSTLVLLFLPGSSGHYHQARSLFSRIDRPFHQNTLFTPSDQLVWQNRHGPLHIRAFSLDWKEQRSALSGAVMRSQMESLNATLAYLYSTFESARLVVVAHSMGGVVMKALLNIECFHADHIDSIYYLGVPLQAPVVMMDSEMKEVYRLAHLRTPHREGIQKYRQFAIAGGVNDYFVHASLTRLDSVEDGRDTYPPEQSIVSSALPHVQTCVEHQALAWCRQLMEVLAFSMLENDVGKRALYFSHPLKPLLQPVVEVAAAKLDVQQISAMEPVSHVVVKQWMSGNATFLPFDRNTGFIFWSDGPFRSVAICTTSMSLLVDCTDASEDFIDISSIYATSAFPSPALTSSPLLVSSILGGSQKMLVLLPHSQLLTSLVRHAINNTLWLRVQGPEPFKENAGGTIAHPLMNSASLSVVATMYRLHAMYDLSSSEETMTLQPGLYTLRKPLRALTDRYFDVSIAFHYDVPVKTLVYAFSRAIDPVLERKVLCAHDGATLASAENYTTVVRFYACPLEREAVFIILLPPPRLQLPYLDARLFDVQFKFSFWSYLHTIFQAFFDSKMRAIVAVGVALAPFRCAHDMLSSSTSRFLAYRFALVPLCYKIIQLDSFTTYFDFEMFFAISIYLLSAYSIVVILYCLMYALLYVLSYILYPAVALFNALTSSSQSLIRNIRVAAVIVLVATNDSFAPSWIQFPELSVFLFSNSRLVLSTIATTFCLALVWFALFLSLSDSWTLWFDSLLSLFRGVRFERIGMFSGACVTLYVLKEKLAAFWTLSLGFRAELNELDVIAATLLFALVSAAWSFRCSSSSKRRYHTLSFLSSLFFSALILPALLSHAPLIYKCNLLFITVNCSHPWFPLLLVSHVADGYDSCWLSKMSRLLHPPFLEPLWLLFAVFLSLQPVIVALYTIVACIAVTRVTLFLLSK